MKIAKIIIVPLTLLLLSSGHAQERFRHAILLHQSTGAVIYGLEGASVNIPQQIHLYNLAHGLTGSDSISCDEASFPAHHDNSWAVWKRIWENEYADDLPTFYLDNYSIIIFKSCFTASDIHGDGSPADTQGTSQTIYNYKWSCRSFLENLKIHPNNFFVIWDGAPTDLKTADSASIARSTEFYDWVVDTLGKGLDSFGPLPPNVMIWDYFHKVDSLDTGRIRSVYETSYGDPHPSDSAAALTAPQFVNEIFGAAIAYEAPLPIQLLEFSATPTGISIVNLEWTTISEINNYGFYLQRDGEDIAFVAGHGTTLQRQTYSYTDNPSTGQHNYRLKQVDLDGTTTYSESVTVNLNAPLEFALAQNYPNPFNPATNIQFSVVNRELAIVKVYDVLGQEVATLVNEVKDPGTYTVQFDASDVPSGVYFYRLHAGDFVATKKLILLK